MNRDTKNTKHENIVVFATLGISIFYSNQLHGNTEVYEQLFSWLSKFSAITKHINRRRFFSMICVLDNHNETAIYSSYTHPSESYWVVPVL